MPVPKYKNLMKESLSKPGSTFKKLDRLGDPRRVDAHGAGGDMLVFNAKLLDKIKADRAFGLEAKALDVALRVVPSQRCEVRAGHGSQQPGGLPIHLHRASILMGFSTTNERGEIHSGCFHPAQVERNSRVASMRHLGGSFKLVFSNGSLFKVKPRVTNRMIHHGFEAECTASSCRRAAMLSGS